MNIETTTRKDYYGNKSQQKIKDDFFKDSNVISTSQSDLAKSERNDCVVRAFMMALDLPYDKAHKFVETKLKRQPRKGTYTRCYIKNILGRQKNGYKMRLMGLHPKYQRKGEKKLVNPKYKKETGYTVKSFMEQHPTGRYFMIVRGHIVFGRWSSLWEFL